MKLRLLIFSLLTLFSLGLLAQTTCTFEEFELDTETYMNDAGSEGFFQMENCLLPNDYNADWGSFSDWAVSNITDNETPGWLNQYSAITGSGVNSSSYGVSFATSGTMIKFSETVQLNQFSITNSTYAYFSMLLGDDFAKKFGGESGDDPDYFELKISNYNSGELQSETIEIRLADFTFENNEADYFIEDWLAVDLSLFELSDSLLLELSSTDNGDFGMNTPAYFCMDNLIYSEINSVSEVKNELDINVFPNPFSDQVIISNFNGRIEVYNRIGEMVAIENSYVANESFDLSYLPSGLYMVQFLAEDRLNTVKLIKD